MKQHCHTVHMWPGMIRKAPIFGGGAAAVKAAAAPPAPAAASGATVAAEQEAVHGDDFGDMGHFTTDEDDDAFSR